MENFLIYKFPQEFFNVEKILLPLFFPLSIMSQDQGANIPPCLSSDPRIPRGGDCEIVPVLDAMPLSISYEEANAYWSD